MFRALANAGANIGLIATSEIRTSCVVAEEAGVQALKVVHTGFDWEVKSVTPPKAPLPHDPTNGLHRGLAHGDTDSNSSTKPRNGPMASGTTPSPMPSPQRCGINSKLYQTSMTQAWSWAGGRWFRYSWITSNCMDPSNRSKPPSPTNGCSRVTLATIAALAN